MNWEELGAASRRISFTSLSESWIEVTPEGGAPRRFSPLWLGGNPDQGGGLEASMLAEMRQQRIGARVAITWTLRERPRLLAIDPA